ncbi:DNA cytosine methyltransferase [Pantoea sp. B9002]|uniref:DNA cytosine methyltransferase n=1 Tax=Pantoea sp. B9002 TaxID=2726979 RepID=UPI00159FF851|nr:DNA cytosine methyltransferase [Pantoea sp. B9002]NWA62881.1 DNA cytosine methyltransferase [Pantoea sp. B9002]
MKKTLKNQGFVAVDLFSGGGGLTLGLKNAGFIVSAAVELDSIASETYHANNPNTVLFSKDIRHVSSEELLATSPTGKIDMIAACPPCQSFSSLTAKYKRKDNRDELINEFARLVREIRPSVIMMENVPGLIKKGSKLFNPVIKEFKKIGYDIDYKVLEVADYGVPQRRKRLVVLGSLNSSVKIPNKTHSESKDDKNTLPWITVREALSGLPEPILLSQSKMVGGPQYFNWNIIRDISPINKERLAHLKEGADRTEIPPYLRPKCHIDNVGFTNVYGRMAWDKPSPTITGGCTTPSKGRFGHPEDIRTISVREAARLQTFPDDFKIKTDFVDRACLIIGNALPPLFATIMAEQCFHILLKEVENGK